MINFFDLNKRKASLVTLIAFLGQMFYPTCSFALTGGPSQIEYDNFEPAGATEMVNLATGDFVYNIPLLDVDGYPINISYHGGVSMEQEASWVGLGWSLNPGAINRGVRGLPDDFNGGSNDKISEEINIKNNKTYGLKLGGGMEVIGFDPATIGATTNLGIVYNNYKGLGLEVELGVTGTISAGNLSATGNLGVNISSQDGVDFTMTGGLGVQASLAYEGSGVGGNLGINRSQNYNSRRGLVSDIISGSAGASVSVYGASYGKTTGSAINLIPNTAYLPNLQLSTQFSGITGEFKTGGEFFWCNLNGSMRGYIFEQGLTNKNITTNAFGYLNLENADYGSTMDFNRDNDGPYYTENPKLPFATLTYDLFNANAQGLNELFRPYRNDFGSVYDNATSGGGTANDIGIEGNYGSYGEIGVNVYGVTTISSSGIWNDMNNAYNLGVKFVGEKLPASGTNTYEHSYFKALDELSIEDPVFYGSINGNELSSFNLNGVGGTNIGILENTINGNNGTSSVYTRQKKDNREPRNSNMSFLNVSEASLFGLDKEIMSYKENIFEYTLDGDLDKNSTSYAPPLDRDFGITGIEHHISEMTILKEDGSRYVYGLPLYNRTQKEVVFNCAGLVPDGNGNVKYTSTGTNPDNSIHNNREIDNFYLGKTLPAYAHSYLLTALLSRDYVDITQDGLSNDDFGDYTKFNYSRASAQYNWRSPVLETKEYAIYNQASYSESKDDKGVYVYGVKEQWYPHSIETKNYIAEFKTLDRLDAFGVESENGGMDYSANNTSKLLDKIVLYSKREKIKEENSGGTYIAVPVKTVNFVYDYSLCSNTPNSKADILNSKNLNKGKLTLKRIFFTYGNSDKGVFSPYKFIYADIDHDGNSDANPSYNRMSMDRWGVYKQELNPHYEASYIGLNNNNFPYTDQKDSTLASVYVSAWNLSTITTPAGSKIDITYESDDYSYIQNETPAQMLKMFGFAKTGSEISGDYISQLYDNFSPYAQRNYMMIDLTDLKGGGLRVAAPDLPTAKSTATAIFQNSMLSSNGKIYFKGFVQIASGSSTQEYVPGYADFDRGSSFVSTDGATPSAGGQWLFTRAVIKLNEVDIEDPINYANGNCNPISKAGWQIARLEHPALAYPGSEPGNNGLAAVAALGASFTEAFTFREKNERLRKKYYSSAIQPTMSFVRLNIPTKTKIGGGHRVSKIEINDIWHDMVPTETSTVYGQTYNYGLPNSSGYLSSGVAAYEPLAGGDEISLRKPVEYSVVRIASPDDAHFFEEPIGEAFYPQATIIYSKITVRNLDRKDVSNNLITSNIGRTEYEFYTAKDFPISSGMDGLQSHIHNPEPDGNLFNSYQESSVHLSQGFILKLNNMHGKLKSVLSYAQGNNTPISGTKYYYKTTANVNVLSNTVSSINENGSIINGNFILGQHVDAVGDFRKSNTITFGNSQTFNLNISPIPCPVAIPIPIPSYFEGSSTEVRDFYSATLNKVVTQQGILEKIETISNYASSTSENLLWDTKTGNVVLSRTSTNYKDFDYSYTTPAHWVYKGMGGAFQNIGLRFTNVVALSSGIITASLLNSGDEVQLIGANGAGVYQSVCSDKLWVNKDASGNLILIDNKGVVCNSSNNTILGTNYPNHILKVIRSGFRNIIDKAAEAITYSNDPRVGNTIDLNHNILDATAVEFSDEWQKYCPYFAYNEVCTLFNKDLTTNPFVLNMSGNWNEKRVYGYLEKRKQKDQTLGNFDIKNDGTFESYKSFYAYSGGSWKSVYDPSRSDYNSLLPFDHWIMNSEITKISPQGKILEGKDAINRFSSNLYGYNYSFKTAFAVNSKQRDIGSDNFEDYSFNNQCFDNHFNFKGKGILSIAGIAHTGRYSIKVKGHLTEMTKLIMPKDCESAYGSNNVFVELPGGGPGGSGGAGDPIDPSHRSRTYGYDCSCISDFSPASNSPNPQKYSLSVWVSEQNLRQKADYEYAKVEVFYDNGTIVSDINNLIKKSGIINGWQKFDYEFTLPANAGTGNLVFRLNNTNKIDNTFVYYDDIRIQPFNSDMKTYVYDPLSLKLWAELDGQNFATIYEYNNEGILVRVKKETEKGIITIKETRNSIKKIVN